MAFNSMHYLEQPHLGRARMEFALGVQLPQLTDITYQCLSPISVHMQGPFQPAWRHLPVAVVKPF
jgi:hypothetical protein